MHRFASLTLAMLMLLALTAGCSNPADDAPDAAVTEPAAVETPAGGGTAFALTPESKIEFVGAKVTGTHDGGFNAFTGSIDLVDGEPTKSTVMIEIDTDSIWSDDDKLTGHLKSDDFFDVANFPTSTFTSTSIVADGELYQVTGNLDLHGVTKSITFPATIQAAPDQVTAQAEFSIKRFDFGIEYKGMADNLIRDEVLIRFDLMAKPGA
ncbi:hypothetical protein ABI59_11320 [Acidobacteria bacterium Mor1]|nr:hypothetical protein ABI59_11320 [Acidobacteria bacterium Mor1]